MFPVFFCDCPITEIESKAEVLITIRWADEHPDDVDALVEDPRGGLVWYHNRDSGLMHLDRDDRGVLNVRNQGVNKLLMFLVASQLVTNVGLIAILWYKLG